MGSQTPAPPPRPWVSTPLVFSAPLTRAAGCNVFLKLENLQPSGSFKSRGIGNLMTRAVAASLTPQDMHFFCSSGGNAGLACATSAAALGCPATIVVPTSTSAFMMGKLRDLGADVVQVGATWAEADAHLRKVLLVEAGSRGVYVPPFDHPDVWAGAATLVDEVADQLSPEHGISSGIVDAFVCSVGGGGLLNGVMAGVEGARAQEDKEGRSIVSRARVLAVETEGADSLAASVVAGKHVTLPGISSIATSLGAIRVSDKTWEWVQRCCLGRGEDATLRSVTISDRDAVLGCLRFLDAARILVEPACGATVAMAFNGDLRRHLGGRDSDDEWAMRNVVLIVCGGSNISLDILEKYKETYAL
jgi:L-serine/L-threonine ammonia-lyase